MSTGPDTLPMGVDPQTCPPDELPTPSGSLDPSALNEYISFQGCDRYFAFRSTDQNASTTHDGEEYREAFEPLNPLLQKAGEDFETLVENRLEPYLSTPLIDCKDCSQDTIVHFLRENIQKAIAATPQSEYGNPIAFSQLRLKGTIGVWTVVGDADITLLWPTRTGCHVGLYDIKSAKEEKTAHQIQTATYSILFEQLLSDDLANLAADIESISTGVITRNTTLDEITPEALPSFPRKSRETDVSRLCQRGGSLHRTYYTDFGDIDHTLDSRCLSCPYSEACYTDAVEEQDIRLLGIPPAQQQVFRSHGIETIEDVADLAFPPDERDMTHHHSVKPKDERLWKTLLLETNLTGGLSKLVERAQIIGGELNCNSIAVDTSKYAQQLVSTGYTPLPDDDPYDDSSISYPSGTLIRCYLTIQQDHLRDRVIALGGRVTASSSEVEAERFGHIADGAPKDSAAAVEVEQTLLKKALTTLRKAIENVEHGILSTDAPPIHFYVYSNSEYEALVELLERHSDLKEAQRLRSFLNLRDSIDQSMVSVVEPVVTNHYGLKTPSSSLLHTVEQLSSKYDYSKPRTDWTYTPDPTGADDWADGQTDVDLQKVFGRRFFYKDVPYIETRSGIEVHPNETYDSSKHDGTYSTRLRSGSAIPLGFLWAAVGRIDDDWADSFDGNEALAESILDEIQYHDANQKEREIAPRDIEALCRHLADALEHVERGIDNKSYYVEKQPFTDPPSELLSTDGPVLEFSTHDHKAEQSRSSAPKETATKPATVPPEEDAKDPLPLAKGCIDYLLLEQEAAADDQDGLLKQPPEERILSGRTIPIIVAEAEVDDEDSELLHVTGKLMYEYQGLFDGDGEEVKQRCRKKGERGTTGGDWVVATPYFPQQSKQPRTKPRDIRKSPQATIIDLDLENDQLQLEFKNFYSGSSFEVFNHDWTTDETEAETSDSKVLVERGQCFLLDPRAGGVTVDRCLKALEHADENNLHDSIEAIRFGTDPAPETTTLPAEQDLEDAFEWLGEEYGPETLPSDEQAAFVEETTNQFQLLQGPPGTGKTGGAEGPGIATRAIAAALGNTSLSTIVVGPSNKSIDEVLEATAEVIDEFRSLTTSSDDIELVRLSSDEPPADEQPPGVTYLNYSDPKDKNKLNTLGNRLGLRAGSSGQTSLTNFGAAEPESTTGGSQAGQTIVFATATRSWGLGKKLLDTTDADKIASLDLWDVLAVDEASMLTVPRFLLAGTNLKSGGQVLVAGDHRQMPPVQQADWQNETRETVHETGAYVSALDYLRFLAGDDNVAGGNLEETVAVDVDRANTGIGITRLSDGRRCPDEITDLLQTHVYELDDIDYQSVADRNPITSVQTASEPARLAIAGDPGIALIVYDDDQSQQVNPAEVAIVDSILEAVPSGKSTGVVAPHNAQRGAVETAIAPSESKTSDVDGEESFTADTVERYQGDERDVIILSATVSDPDYINVEDKFLLSLNRANVAMSRAREKLVVVVAQSVIEHIPSDPDVYDEATLWKGLSEYTGHASSDTPSIWKGTLSDFDSILPLDNSDSVSVSLYSNSHRG